MGSSVTRRVLYIWLVVAIWLMAAITPAVAKPPRSQATDPGAGSPAGAIYAIPLDTARQDAAPHGHHGAGVGGNGGSSGGGGTGATGGGGTGGAGGGGTGSGGSAGGGSGGSGSGGGGSGGAAGRGSGAAHHSGSGSGTSSRTGGNSSRILIPGGQPGSLLHSSNGFGSSSKVPGLNAPAGAGLDTVQGNASSAPLLAIVLAAVVLAVGGFAGVRASSRRMRGHQPSGSGASSA